MWGGGHLRTNSPKRNGIIGSETTKRTTFKPEVDAAITRCFRVEFLVLQRNPRLKRRRYEESEFHQKRQSNKPGAKGAKQPKNGRKVTLTRGGAVTPRGISRYSASGYFRAFRRYFRDLRRYSGSGILAVFRGVPAVFRLGGFRLLFGAVWVIMFEQKPECRRTDGGGSSWRALCEGAAFVAAAAFVSAACGRCFLRRNIPLSLSGPHLRSLDVFILTGVN